VAASSTTVNSDKLKNELEIVNKNMWRKWSAVIAPLVMQLVILVDVDQPYQLFAGKQILKPYRMINYFLLIAFHLFIFLECCDFGEFFLPTKIHIIAFGAKFRHGSKQHIEQQMNISILERLASNNGGSFELFRPTDGSRLLKKHFDTILERECTHSTLSIAIYFFSTLSTVSSKTNNISTSRLTVLYFFNVIRQRI
jgi:hypothetical protein